MRTNTLQLSAYSALAAGFMSMQQDADAQVVYTDLEPDFIFHEPEAAPQFGYAAIDFNADANAELGIGFSSFRFSGSCYSAGSMSFYMLNNAFVQVIEADGPKIKILNEGEMISSGGSLWQNIYSLNFMVSDFYMDNCDTDIEYAHIEGNWLAETDKYVAVKFLISGVFHLGWVRVTCTITASEGDAEINEISIDGYAYEQSALTSISAGDGYIPDALESLNNISTKVYPNPATEFVTIETQNLQHQFSYLLYSINGLIISSGEMNGTQTTISLKDLAAGMYVLQIIDENNYQVASNKIQKL